MSIITKMRKQEAIYWKRLTPDQYGKYSFDSPVEISCRWEDKASEFLDSTGQKQVSRSIVYVDRVISVGDRLMRGEMDSNTPADPLTADSFEVRRFDQEPNLKATEFLLTAYL